jgi:hypothetical protein
MSQHVPDRTEVPGVQHVAWQGRLLAYMLPAPVVAEVVGGRRTLAGLEEPMAPKGLPFELRKVSETANGTG